MKKLFVLLAGLAMLAMSHSAAAQEEPCKALTSNPFGAIFKSLMPGLCGTAQIAQTASRYIDREETTASASRPVQEVKTVAQSGEQADAMNQAALETWSADGRDYHRIRQHCERATLNAADRFMSKNACSRYLANEFRADDKSRQIAQREASDKRLEDINKRKDSEFMARRTESEAIAVKIEAGDRSAYDLCLREESGKQRDGDFYRTCIPIAERALAKALRAKKFLPENCRMWDIANSRDGESTHSAMRVSMGSDGKNGFFNGEVTQINGKTITVFNRASQLNAIVVLDNKTQVFNGQMVAIGLPVYGIGIQTEARQVTLANLQASTIPVIAAKCVGDF